MYLGHNRLGMAKSWECEYNEGETRLMLNAVPVTRMYANPAVYALNGALAEAVTQEDLPSLFSKPILMDVQAFQTLAKKFPQLDVFQKVDLLPG